jgi:hypothetical protein
MGLTDWRHEMESPSPEDRLVISDESFFTSIRELSSPREESQLELMVGDEHDPSSVRARGEGLI